MTNLRDPYIYAMELLCKLCGESNYIHFKYARLPIVHIVIEIGVVFNWEIILSYAMKRDIERENKLFVEILPNFYMDSCLLSIICASKHFSRLHWSWTIVGSPIHMYCQGLWENKYNRYDAQLCDFFIAPLYK
jgi:hypothetical protein